MYLLNFSWRAQEALWEMLQRGVVILHSLEEADLIRMRELMKKYRDLPMDLADAALVAIAERERIRRIFTLDRRDFQIYRPAKVGRFSILPG
jgi:predicted nucleic acid-binding protein